MFSAIEQQQNDPIIVRIIEPPSDLESLGDVLLGALGITGVIVVAAVVAGVLFAVVMFVMRRYQASDQQGPVA